MSFWDKLVSVAEVVGNAVMDAAEKQQVRKAKYVDNVYRSQARLKTKSPSELAEIARSQTGPESIAAKLELRERKTGPSPVKKSPSKKPTVKRTASTHYNPGRRDIKVGFVLSAPGSKEEGAGRPAYGATGANLETMIREWHRKRPDLFISLKRYDYCITNASRRVEYKAKTKRSEASKREIVAPDNIERLLGELSGCEFVVCLGVKARFVKSALEEKGFPGTVVSGIHPAWRAINGKYPKLDKDGRLRAAADDVSNQF